jgi:hypothetical protein
MSNEQTDDVASSAAAAAGTDSKRVPVTRRPHRSAERAGADEAAAAEEVTGLYYSTRFGVLKSLRYLAKRRSHFDFLHAASKAVSAILGGATFVALVGGKDADLAKWSALGVAIASTLDVVVGFADRARKADRQYQRFAELAATIETMDTANLDPKAVRQAAAKRLIIEKDDPTVLVALNIICHNEEAEAEGYGSDQRYRVGWLQSVLAQGMTLPWFKLRPMKPDDPGAAAGI